MQNSSFLIIKRAIMTLDTIDLPSLRAYLSALRKIKQAYLEKKVSIDQLDIQLDVLLTLQFMIESNKKLIDLLSLLENTKTASAIQLIHEHMQHVSQKSKDEGMPAVIEELLHSMTQEGSLTAVFGDLSRRKAWRLFIACVLLVAVLIAPSVSIAILAPVGALGPLGIAISCFAILSYVGAAFGASWLFHDAEDVAKQGQELQTTLKASGLFASSSEYEGEPTYDALQTNLDRVEPISISKEMTCKKAVLRDYFEKRAFFHGEATLTEQTDAVYTTLKV